jgi:hypothetical protein
VPTNHDDTFPINPHVPGGYEKKIKMHYFPNKKKKKMKSIKNSGNVTAMD